MRTIRTIQIIQTCGKRLFMAWIVVPMDILACWNVINDPDAADTTNTNSADRNTVSTAVLIIYIYGTPPQRSTLFCLFWALRVQSLPVCSSCRLYVCLPAWIPQHLANTHTHTHTDTYTRSVKLGGTVTRIETGFKDWISILQSSFNPDPRFCPKTPGRILDLGSWIRAQIETQSFNPVSILRRLLHASVYDCTVSRSAAPDLKPTSPSLG